MFCWRHTIKGRERTQEGRGQSAVGGPSPEEEEGLHDTRKEEATQGQYIINLCPVVYLERKVICLIRHEKADYSPSLVIVWYMCPLEFVEEESS